MGKNVKTDELRLREKSRDVDNFRFTRALSIFDRRIEGDDVRITEYILVYMLGCGAEVGLKSFF